MNSSIVILTDFGTIDPYVGIMKGVIHKIAPLTSVIDLGHEIPPGDIRRGAVTLWQAVNYFAPGTVFLIVIDPGVGTARKPIVFHNGSHTFIAPNNGVLSFIDHERAKAWEISNPQFLLPDPGTTFHGRDIFSPAAAYASLGVSVSKFGDQIKDLVMLDIPRIETHGSRKLNGQVLYTDHFGNLITSLGKFSWTVQGLLSFRSWVGETIAFTCLPESLHLEIERENKLPLVKTFADIPAGECAVLVGSSGLLEIVANRQSAANLLNLGADELVTIKYKPVIAK